MVRIDLSGHGGSHKLAAAVGKLFPSLFFLVFFGMGSLFEVFFAREFGRAIGQRFWEKIPCAIVRSEVLEQSGHESRFAFTVSYQFQRAGQWCTGSTYKRSYSVSSTYSAAQELAQRYPAGLRTFCYVDRKDPGAVVLQGDSLAIGLALFFPLIFVLFGAWGIYFTWRRPRPEREKPIAGDALRKGTSHRVRHALAAFFALFAVVGGAMLYPFGIKPIARTIAARSWAPTPCQVLRAEVRSHDSDDGTTYSVYILYQYEFRGQTYKGDRYSFVGGSSSGYEAKARVVEQYETAARPICYVDPHHPAQAVLKRGFHAGLLLVLIPLAFLLVGTGGSIGVLRWAGTAKFPTTAGMLPEQTPVGQAVLMPKFSPRAKFLGMTIFALIWNGIVSLFAWDSLSSLAQGHTPGFGLLVITLFAAIGLALVGGAVYQFLALFNPRPTLELSCGRIPLGGAAELRWSLSGRTRRIEQFTVTLRGIEEAKYRQGTNTCTDRNTFYEMELYRTSDPNEIAAGQVGFVMPPDTMHSFEAENNKILWSLDLHGSIAHWPDVKESFPITVTPYDQTISI